MFKESRQSYNSELFLITEIKLRQSNILGILIAKKTDKNTFCII